MRRVVIFSACITLLIEFLGLYTIYPWADTLAHFCAGIAIIGTLLLIYPDTPWTRTLPAIVGIAIVWEVLEIVLPGFSGLLALGIVDTTVDIVATIAGGIISHAMRAYA